MARKTCAIVIVTAICVAIGEPATAGKKTATKPDPSIGAVEKVLRAEVAGEVDRRSQLATTLEQNPDSRVARWQAGYVRDGQSWLSFDSGPQPADSEVREAYLTRRRETPQTLAGQLDLANWCRKQKLSDQERAHVYGALLLAPDGGSDDLLMRAGFCQVGGMWLSRDDLLEWQRLNRQTQESLKSWEAHLSAIVDKLEGQPRDRERALSRLHSISDPSAIPAIELVLAGRSEEMAMTAVGAMRRLDGHIASLALAKQGLFSEWPKVRKAACDALKTRKFEDFVPPVISLLTTPAQAQWSVSTNFRNFAFCGPVVLYFSFVLARETEQQFQVANFRIADYRVNDFVNGMQVNGGKFRANRGDNALDRGLARGANDSLRDAAAQLKSLDEFNRATEEMNSRIGEFLAAVSDENASSDPTVWWNWWRSYSDTQLAGPKTVVSVTEENYLGNPSSRGIIIMSCFAAGTPVWTDAGLVAIEKISAGDRVLSKNVESGELAYMPVLQTTVRPPKELTALRLSDETIVCTRGHRFWVSGNGWIKARDLEPQSLLHTVTGNSAVWKAKNGQTAETYNLVVADFHTYFVGKAGILCQDLAIPKPTNCVVPGLDRKRAVAPTK